MSAKVRLPNGDVINERRNGSNELTYKWLVGVLLVIVFGIGSWWLTSVYAAVSDQTDRIYTNSDRISRVEVRMIGIESSLSRIENNLEKILGRNVP